MVDSPQLWRLDAMLVHDLLQLADSQAGHVQLVLDLPKVRVADGIVAAVLLEDLGGLEDGAAEGQRLAHGQRDERTAVAAILFGQPLADVLEVDVLQQQEERRQQDAGHQEQEGGQELLEGQRVGGLVLLLPRPARARHPVASQPLQVSVRPEL